MYSSNTARMGNALNVWNLYGSDFDDFIDDRKTDGVNLEASPDIRVLVLYEQPQGTGLHMNVTLDPSRTTLALKSDLSNLTSVPVDSVSLIHRNHLLEDDKSLHTQGVEDKDTIVLRDLRLTYNF